MLLGAYSLLATDLAVLHKLPPHQLNPFPAESLFHLQIPSPNPIYFPDSRHFLPSSQAVLLPLVVQTFFLNVFLLLPYPVLQPHQGYFLLSLLHKLLMSLFPVILQREKVQKSSSSSTVLPHFIQCQSPLSTHNSPFYNYSL